MAVDPASFARLALRSTSAFTAIALLLWAAWPDANRGSEIRFQPALSGLACRMLADAQDGTFDDFDLVTAALIASGVDDECELSGWLDFYFEQRARLVGEVASGSLDDELKRIHSALHQRLLRGRYRSSATDLRIALARGDYNCLSAAVLYVDSCRAAGLDLAFWSQTGHAFVRSTGAGAVRIEPGARRWRHNSAIADADARQITPVQLIARFYYNRGLEHLAKREFPAGLALIEISLQLDPDDADARQNLLAGINNWAVECCRGERYRQAAELIQQGLAIEPGFSPLRVNEQFVRQRLAD